MSAPPQLAPSELVQYIKGRSSRQLQEEFEDLRKRYWGQHLWAQAYFCATVDEETIKKYISTGTRMPKDSRSPRPPSLEPALQPGTLQAASAASRLSKSTYRLSR